MADKREWMADLVCDVAGSILFALGFYTFAENASFAPGGMTGTALLIRHFIPLPIGITTLLLNVPIILYSYPTLGKKFFLRSIRTMLISTFFLDVAMPQFPVYEGSQMLMALFNGVCSGAGLGLIYMRGSSTGGTDFLLAAIKKKQPHLSFGQLTLVMDGVVVLAGGIVFKTADAVLYGLVAVFAATVVMDRIITGAGSGKLVIAVTDHADQAAKEISDAVQRGATITRATGAYTGQEHQILLCMCANREVALVERAILRADARAILTVCDATETFGEGFGELNKE